MKSVQRLEWEQKQRNLEDLWEGKHVKVTWKNGTVERGEVRLVYARSGTAWIALEKQPGISLRIEQLTEWEGPQPVKDPDWWDLGKEMVKSLFRRI